MDLQDLQPPFSVRNTYLYFSIEPSWSAQCRIDSIQPVSGSYYHYLSTLFQAIHHSEQLGYYSALNLPCNVLSFWSNRIYLIDEYYRWCILFGLFEYLADTLFAFTIVFSHDLRASDIEEIGPGFICYCLGDEGLSSSGRSI